MNDSERYEAAAHAMQSGVAMEMNYDTTETEPKHLRVGVNSALVSHAALVRLLISKGIITKDEYLKALAGEMEAEAARYQDRVSQRFGPGSKITLA